MTEARRLKEGVIEKLRGCYSLGQLEGFFLIPPSYAKKQIPHS